MSKKKLRPVSGASSTEIHTALDRAATAFTKALNDMGIEPAGYIFVCPEMPGQVGTVSNIKAPPDCGVDDQGVVLLILADTLQSMGMSYQEGRLKNITEEITGRKGDEEK